MQFTCSTLFIVVFIWSYCLAWCLAFQTLQLPLPLFFWSRLWPRTCWRWAVILPATSPTSFPRRRCWWLMDHPSKSSNGCFNSPNKKKVHSMNDVKTFFGILNTKNQPPDQFLLRPAARCLWLWRVMPCSPWAVAACSQATSSGCRWVKDRLSLLKGYWGFYFLGNVGRMKFKIWRTTVYGKNNNHKQV